MVSSFIGKGISLVDAPGKEPVGDMSLTHSLFIDTELKIVFEYGEDFTPFRV